MDDLISRSELIKAIRLYMKKTSLGETLSVTEISIGELASILNNLPISFDLDKVINQLEDKAIEELGITKSQFDMDRAEYSSCCSLCLGDVVEIIKKGGIK